MCSWRLHELLSPVNLQASRPPNWVVFDVSRNKKRFLFLLLFLGVLARKVWGKSLPKTKSFLSTITGQGVPLSRERRERLLRTPQAGAPRSELCRRVVHRHGAEEWSAGAEAWAGWGLAVQSLPFGLWKYVSLLRWPVGKSEVETIGRGGAGGTLVLACGQKDVEACLH